MKAGIYTVLEIKDVGLTGENGNEKPYMRFSVDTEEGPQEIAWFGNLKGNDEKKQKIAQEMTVKALVTAGFIGDDFADLAKPGASELYFNKKNLTVTVELYNDKPQIKWINEKRAKKEFTGTAPKFASLFAQVKKDMGVEEIPF